MSTLPPNKSRSKNFPFEFPGKKRKFIFGEEHEELSFVQSNLSGVIFEFLFPSALGAGEHSLELPFQ